MGEVTQSIDIEVDLETVYNQWTQFEEFPMFMEGVTRVDQLDDQRLRWTVDIAGVEREFDAKITEQSPDQRIAWKSTSGVDQAGVVTFHRLSDRQTRVTLQMNFDPEGFVEQAGDKLGFVAARTKGDLERFKSFIEERQIETGRWRGEIEHGRGVTSDDNGAPAETDTQSGEETIAELTEVDISETDAWANAEGVGDHVDQATPDPDRHDGGMRRFGG